MSSVLLLTGAIAGCTSTPSGVRGGAGIGYAGVHAARDLDNPGGTLELGDSSGVAGYVELAIGSEDPAERDLVLGRLAWNQLRFDLAGAPSTAPGELIQLQLLYAPELVGRRDAVLRALVGPCLCGASVSVPDGYRGGDFRGLGVGGAVGLEVELLRSFTVGAVASAVALGYPGDTLGYEEGVMAYFGVRF